MEEEHITSEAQPDESELGSSDSGETGSVGLADILKEELGRNFKDDESALKFIKDNDSFSGKVKNYQDVIGGLETKFGGQEKAINALKKFMTEEQQVQDQPVVKDDGLVDEVRSLRAELNENKFYKENPQYEPYKEVIRKLGSDPAQVVADETNKSYLGKMIAHDELESSKSVLRSNSRLGMVVDKATKAREHLKNASEALKSGDTYSANQAANAARESAVGSVLDAYER